MDIKAFLLPPVTEETKKVIVTDRIKDEEGNPIPFTIRRISQEENDDLVRRAQKEETKNGRIYQKFNDIKYGNMLVQKCVVEPDFTDRTMCNHYGTVDPLLVPRRMLLPGEFARLMKEINSFNGFDPLTDNAIAETAKNS